MPHLRPLPRCEPAATLALLCVLAAGCRRVDQDGAAIVAPPGPPAHRIVCLNISSVDTLIQLDALDQCIAVEEDVFLAGTEHLVKIRNDDHAGPSKQLNVEAILALEPDAVIGSETLKAALDHRGLRMLWSPARGGFASIGPMTLAIGDLVGKRARAEQLLQTMHTRMASIRQRTASLPKVRVYFEAGLPGRTAGRGTIVGDMIELAGGTNIAGEAPLANPVLSSEAIVQADPEVILLSPWSDPPAAVAQRPGWARIRAVREHRIHQIPERNRRVQYASPSCVEACEQVLLPWLHPETTTAAAPRREH